MTAKSPITVLFTALLLLGVGTALFLQHRSLADLERENQSLRQRLAELSRLPAENQRLSNLLAQASSSPSLPTAQWRELLKLRSEVGRLRQQNREVANSGTEIQPPAQATPAADSTPVAASPGPVPKESWAFAGYATPEAAYQSAIWAVNSGDLKTFYASLTEKGRQQFAEEKKGKTEADLVREGIEILAKCKAFRVDDRQDRPDGSVVLKVSMIRHDDTVEPEKMTLRKAGDAWKLDPD